MKRKRKVIKGDGDRNWSEVPEDLLILISKRLYSVNDYFNFSYVCKSWRSSIVDAGLLIPQPPLLMLPDHTRTRVEEEGQHQRQDTSATTHTPYRRGFLGLTKGGREFINKVYELHLPETRKCRYIGSKGNWVVTVDMKLKIHIINPFSRVQLDLPSQSELDCPYRNAMMNNRQLREVTISKVVLSSTPSCNRNSSRDNCVALAIHDMHLSIARPGDISWTNIQGIDDVDDVIFFKEKFYAITRHERLFVCDFDCYPHKVTELLKGKFDSSSPANKHYLVEWMGELLLAIRYDYVKVIGKRREFKTLFFLVYKFDFATLEWKLVQNLGCHSLFLGYNTSVSVLASDSSSFRGNCIYFTEGRLLEHYYIKIRTKNNHAITERGYHMGVFHLESRKVHPLYDDIAVTSPYALPVWIIPKSIDQLQS